MIIKMLFGDLFSTQTKTLNSNGLKEYYNNLSKEEKSSKGKNVAHKRKINNTNNGGRPPSFNHSKDWIEGQRLRMLNGQASYMNSFITNPSKPQVELYKAVLFLCPYAILNYPCLNYSIDIAIPFLNIAIEYDGSYWHQDINYHKQRQNDLEQDGWVFLRYVDYLPKIDDLFNDIKSLKNKEIKNYENFNK